MTKGLEVIRWRDSGMHLASDEWTAITTADNLADVMIDRLGDIGVACFVRKDIPVRVVNDLGPLRPKDLPGRGSLKRRAQYSLDHEHYFLAAGLADTVARLEQTAPESIKELWENWYQDAVEGARALRADRLGQAI